jgi:hypothetical protein
VNFRAVRWKIVLMRVIGATLVVSGLVAGYYWFYVFAPMRRMYDPAWYVRHSHTAYWEECQSGLNRYGWDHDSGHLVGRFGDKQFFQRIISKVKPDDDIESCSVGHKHAALSLMTNQDAGDAAGWLAWWEENKSKSQEDWIRDGFRKFSIDVQSPLTPSNIIALLKITQTTDKKKCDVPNYVQYNAFRWLRDSDFDPRKFSLKDIPATDGDAVLQGLVHFAQRSGEFPKNDGLGILCLGKPPDTSHVAPQLAMPRFKAIANAIVFVPLCSGLLLLWASFRRRKIASQ